MIEDPPGEVARGATYDPRTGVATLLAGGTLLDLVGDTEAAAARTFAGITVTGAPDTVTGVPAGTTIVDCVGGGPTGFDFSVAGNVFTGFNTCASPGLMDTELGALTGTGTALSCCTGGVLTCTVIEFGRC